MKGAGRYRVVGVPSPIPEVGEERFVIYTVTFTGREAHPSAKLAAQIGRGVGRKQPAEAAFVAFDEF